MPEDIPRNATRRSDRRGVNADMAAGAESPGGERPIVPEGPLRVAGALAEDITGVTDRAAYGIPEWRSEKSGRRDIRCPWIWLADKSASQSGCNDCSQQCGSHPQRRLLSGDGRTAHGDQHSARTICYVAASVSRATVRSY